MGRVTVGRDLGNFLTRNPVKYGDLAEMVYACAWRAWETGSSPVISTTIFREILPSKQGVHPMGRQIENDLMWEHAKNLAQTQK